ncbi:MAG: ABC transporter ATP-binding protein [Candidatus Hydrogenedentota bacterium]
MTALLRAENLKIYRGEESHPIVDVEELSLERGECLALLGPNAAGKSTFLRTLGLLQEHHEGRLWILGQEVLRDTRDDLRSRIATLLQNPILFRGKVRDHIRFGMDGTDTGALMDRMGIAHLADRHTGALSGGEARRVALAAVLAREPALVFLDEPTDGLDETSRTDLIRDLGRIKREQNLSMMIVTHRRLEAVALADRIAVMRGGKIVQIGSASDVMNAPVDPDAADFLGFENLWHGVVESSSGGIVLVRLTSGHHIEASGDMPAGRQVIAGIRAEDMSISLETADHVPAPRGSARNHLSGEIVSVEPRWIVTALALRFPGSASPLSGHCVITSRSAEELTLKPGARVIATFKAVNVRVWDY